MNISRQTVDELREKGWDIQRVSEIMDVSTSDREILYYARENNLVCITQDLDFSALLALGGHKKPSVINLRLRDISPSHITKRLIEIAPFIIHDVEGGAIVSVDESSIRARRLPIELN